MELLNIGTSVKIVSYNIEFAKATTPEAVAEHLRDEQPDIICFSEVPGGAWTSLAGKALGMKYGYAGLIASADHREEYRDTTGEFFGKYKSILSKTPLTDSHEEILEGRGWHPASVVFARTEVKGVSLLVGSLHIPTGGGNPEASCASSLVQMMDSYNDERVIIAGDFNDRVSSAPMHLLYDHGFRNPWLETNFNVKERKTFNAQTDRSEGVIDHILYRGALNVVTADILSSGVPQSDHYAISATFSL